MLNILHVCALYLGATFNAISNFLDTPAFVAFGAPTSVAEVIGFVCGALCVWLAARENVLNFLMGILTTATFLLLFADKHLYGDAALQLMFLSLNAYGWWRWFVGDGAQHQLAISRLSQRGWILVAASAVIGTPLLQQLLIANNDSAPFWDSLITTLSVIAQVLLNRKVLENWWLWIVVDLVSIPLYVSKDLHLTSLLYVVFLGLCVSGWVAWRRSLRTEIPTPA